MAEVVTRTGRGALLLVLAAVGFLEVGLVAGFVTALRSDQLGSVWGVLGLLALLLGAAVVLIVPRLVHPTTTTVSEAGYRLLRGRKVAVELAAAELTAVVYRPAQQTTWQRTDPDDPTTRGVGRWRTQNRIELRSGTTTVEVYDGPRWREVVGIVRGWVAADPSLAADDATRELLASPGAADPTAPRKPRWPLGLVRLAVRERDPWAPFLPDAYGEYSSWFGGRWTAVRATGRGSTAGLVWRWAFLLLTLAPLLLVVWGLVMLVLAVVAARSALDGIPDDESLQRGPVGQVVVLDEGA